MERYLIIIILAMCFFMNSKAQNKVQKPNAPKEDIKVNREYDDKELPGQLQQGMQPKSMDEMMKILHLQMQEIE